MKNINMKNFVKIIGLVSMIVSVGAELLDGYVSDKKMEQMIDDKISERLKLEEKDDNEEEGE